jgi:hypothetical protein
MSSLNRKKPYGEIWGANTNARFHQDGKYFDAAGEQVGHPGGGDAGESQQLTAPPPPGPVGPSQAEINAADAALAQRQAALQLQAFKLLNLAVDKVVAELADASDEMLPVLRSIEAEVKNRQPVLDAIDAEAKLRADKAAEAAGKTAQVNTQLSA